MSTAPYTVEEMKKSVRMYYRVGPLLSEAMLGFLVKLRHPKTWFKASRPPRLSAAMVHHAALRWEPALRSAAAVIMALSRRAELAADLMAAEVLGSAEPVVKGLVLLHGTATERRRLGRGDVHGLMEDASADLSSRRRWYIWWASAIKARARPPLEVRIAALATWRKA